MKYNLAQVTSITTGRLMTAMDDLHATLNKMLDQPLWTHHIPPAVEIMREKILEHHPGLPKSMPDWVKDADSVHKWLDENIPIYGNSFEVACVKADPEKLSELIMAFINKGGKVIAVEIDG